MRKLPRNQRKAFSIYVRLTAPQKTQVEEAAMRSKMKLSPWVLARILDASKQSTEA